MPNNCCELIILALIKIDTEYVKEMIINENREDLILDEEDYDGSEEDIILGEKGSKMSED